MSDAMKCNKCKKEFMSGPDHDSHADDCPCCGSTSTKMKNDD